MLLEKSSYSNIPKLKSNNSSIPTENNILTLHPVHEEFHYEKNYPLKPENFTLKSERKVWWQCSKQPEHVWKTTVASRTGGRDC